MQKNSNFRRSFGLDCLRGASIVIVLSNHALIGFFFSTGRLRFEGALGAVSAFSVIAIEWLFVLSGYLIGAMMIRSFESGGSFWESAKDFWLRRWFRTLPNYYLFVLINIFIVWIGWHNGVFDYSFLYFSQNLYKEEISPHFFGESWSLALDEWFYFLMPILLGSLFCVKRMGNKWRFFGVAIFLIAFPVAARLLHSAPLDFLEWDAKIRRITLYHLDATGWGVLAASVNKWCPLWWRSMQRLKAGFGVFLMFLGLMLVASFFDGYLVEGVDRKLVSVWCISFMALGTFLVMPWLTQGFEGFSVVTAMVERLSMYSYSIYLSHFPLIFVFLHFFPVTADTSASGLFFVMMGWIFSVFLVSAFVYHFFEGPAANLRDRLQRGWLHLLFDFLGAWLFI